MFRGIHSGTILHAVANIVKPKTKVSYKISLNFNVRSNVKLKPPYKITIFILETLE